MKPDQSLDGKPLSDFSRDELMHWCAHWHRLFCAETKIVHTIGFKRFAWDLSAQIGAALQQFDDPDALVPHLRKLEAILAEISPK